MTRKGKPIPATIELLRRLAASLAALTIVATGCTDDPSGTQPTTTNVSVTRPPKSAPPDEGLRDVTKAMIFGDGIAYVLPETAAQMICGALSPTGWHDAIGGKVGRTVLGGVDAKCVVSTGSLVVEMQMAVEALGAASERIAERRVQLDTMFPSRRSASASAAVVPLGEQDVPAQHRLGADPVLRVMARMTDEYQAAPDFTVLLRRLLAALLPRLTPDGPATPVYDSAGKLTYAVTEPVAGVPIYDLPQTVQSMVLCTVALRETGIKPQPGAILVNSVSECYISQPTRIFAKVDQFLDPVQEQFKLADRWPAQEVADVGIVIDLLTMPTEYGHFDHLTLRLQNYKPSAHLRAWANQVGPALLAA